ncbi:MAG: N utilization substance protein A [Parcubacteria group bacterium Gr01-1014_66]|nr:MAG: N utilization substance protein A [Parcubacteria group bacterium Gr01-1014_66]
MDFKSFTSALQQIADEKGIAKERVIETIEIALAAAYKRDYGKRGQIIRAHLDLSTGHVTMSQVKVVMDESMVRFIEGEEEGEEVEHTAGSGSQRDIGQGRPQEQGEEVVLGEQQEEKKPRFNPERHVLLEEVRASLPDIKPGEEIIIPLETHESYGRIAAQTAKQVVMQRIREAEREAIYEEYKHREGEIISGIVQRIEGRAIFVDMGKAVGVLPPEEQIPRERQRIGERVKALILLVEKDPRGPGVILSRSHPRLLKKLFEVEVPEVVAGTVEIKIIAREAGSRAKVAVLSHEANVDPVGSMVGQKGVRVSAVIHEVGGEKIDIIEWSEDPARFIASALSPAKVRGVMLDNARREARVEVPEDQLSLAIGRAGQNVRLAAKLTGWKIEVRGQEATTSETDAAESEAQDSRSGSSDASIEEKAGDPEQKEEEGASVSVAGT